MLGADLKCPKRDKTDLKDRNIIARGVAPDIKKGSEPSPEGLPAGRHGRKKLHYMGSLLQKMKFRTLVDADSFYVRLVTSLQTDTSGRFTLSTDPHPITHKIISISSKNTLITHPPKTTYPQISKSLRALKDNKLTHFHQP
ncbi:hypothetical protein CJD36_020380 [Flavipsychrobacter stenotrophus]|uniref:Uncharacterized protein n=1 Tax=Flavipsychrobacter stenotrophus TaxID=2077091 RepID=A0A2S7SQI7_9BACT|nr:hypothetical protein CJD36_020380 [Flavipsychrobacter stenotrophus]